MKVVSLFFHLFILYYIPFLPGTAEYKQLFSDSGLRFCVFIKGP